MVTLLLVLSTIAPGTTKWTHRACAREVNQGRIQEFLLGGGTICGEATFWTFGVTCAKSGFSISRYLGTHTYLGSILNNKKNNVSFVLYFFSFLFLLFNSNDFYSSKRFNMESPQYTKTVPQP